MLQSPLTPPHPVYFCTLRLADPGSDLLIRAIDDLRRAMRETKTLRPLRIDAITVLPSTLHMLMSLPEGESSPASRIAMLKTRFSRTQAMPANRTLAQIERAEKGIWQRHSWTHRIEDTADYARHRDLIYLSPVHAGFCARPEHWPHTSLHRDRRAGMTLPPVPKGARKKPLVLGKSMRRAPDALTS